MPIGVKGPFSERCTSTMLDALIPPVIGTVTPSEHVEVEPQTTGASPP